MLPIYQVFRTVQLGMNLADFSALARIISAATTLSSSKKPSTLCSLCVA